MNITLYTTQHCPICRMVKDMLTQRNIEFNIVDDLEVMTLRGFKSAPMVEVGGEVMNAKEAIKWIKTL